jgi:hypothetical protein
VSAGRTKDLKRLEEIAEAGKSMKAMFAERRLIWLRRARAGDTSQSELARRSHTSRAIVNQALKGERGVTGSDGV